MQTFSWFSLSRLWPLLSAPGILTGSIGAVHAQTVETWNGGTGKWGDATFWNNGVPNGAAADVFIDDGSTINATQGKVTNYAGSTLTGGSNTVLSTGSTPRTPSLSGGGITTNAAAAAHRRLSRLTPFPGPLVPASKPVAGTPIEVGWDCSPVERFPMAAFRPSKRSV